ncbi:FAD-dependent oxidoreductase [Amycolatopsis benzoatilytica]|uniref:FAD-dependent oxidoreductase n=1 Tax=Amycolatopsis benzoatilytica TaxID=346045 RepID=UPI000375799E|nr:FAD-dependent oxidoreductase [Amycolatopsis benzoatilytica]
MTHVVTRACCNDASCVAVCPVNCIHPTPDEPDYGTAEMLYIDPAGCVDCGACVEVCPVGAISADYDLTDEQIPFEELNARWFDGPGRRDYPQEQQVARVREWAGGDLRVAVVGSGPAACYAAEELLAQRGLDVRVDMFERLPTPGGLVRFGVAPDHQDTKDATRAFANTMRRKGFRLFLNTEIGSDLRIDELRERYHAVVVAVGALTDRPLGIPGEDLPGSHSATEFVGWYNGHPDFAHRTFDLSGERAVVIGNGNVALDVARILTADPERLAKTDIADPALAQLRSSSVREVVVVGRRGPVQAAFTTKELLGLARTPGADLVVRPEELPEPDGESKIDLLAELAGRRPSADRRVALRFLAAPTEITGDGWVEGVRLCRTRLVADNGVVRAIPTDDFEELACGLVFRSVGYRGSPLPGLPFDDRRGVIPNDAGRVAVPGVYATGWIKRGPSGVIGTNRKCARDTVGALLDDFREGRLPAPAEAGDIADVLPRHIDLGGWRRINDHEVDAGRRQRRPRVKLVDVAEMLAVARQDG